MSEPKEIREKILAQARENRRRHLAEGLYTAEEEARLTGLELTPPGAELPPVSVLEELQFRLSQSFDPAAVPRITSHRPVLGPVIVAAKKGLLKLMRPLLSVLFAQQTEFRRNLVDFSHELVEAYARQEERLDSLSQRVVRLVRRLEEGGPEEKWSSAQISQSPPPADLPPLEYLALEDRHRGSGPELKARQEPYLAFFQDLPGPVLDLGCGRGEFLELLREAGIQARGVDLNPEMVGLAREKGLEAQVGEGLEHLRSLDQASLGGLFLAQVIEHLDLPRINGLLEAAFRALAPGGVILAETINPQSLVTFASALYLDPTHLRPVHPEAARFLLESTGFKEIRVIQVNPVPDRLKLALVGRWTPGAERLNANLKRLNELLFGPQDYAVVARR